MSGNRVSNACLVQNEGPLQRRNAGGNLLVDSRCGFLTEGRQKFVPIRRVTVVFVNNGAPLLIG